MPFRSFCLQAKGLALISKRPFGYKREAFRLQAKPCFAGLLWQQFAKMLLTTINN
jgi:hypothetical protein